MSSEPVKVLLVDDHALMLKGLRLQLEQAGGVEVVGAVSTGKQALQFAQNHSFHVAVVDLHLPDMDGIHVARALLAQMPSLNVVMLSSDAGISPVKEALLAGVKGYVLKENTDRELVLAIHEVTQGKPYLCPQICGPVLEDYRRFLALQAAPKPQLSEREREVLQMIAEGARNKEVAARMNIGVKSVETYRRRLMDKLKIRSTAELTRYAIREGIVDL
jgi:DNA-binding NarL/FixJ family response regulator